MMKDFLRFASTWEAEPRTNVSSTSCDCLSRIHTSRIQRMVEERSDPSPTSPFPSPGIQNKLNIL